MSLDSVLYSTANDPETANNPQNGPQMILDRKWSLKSTANDPVKNVFTFGGAKRSGSDRECKYFPIGMNAREPLWR